MENNNTAKSFFDKWDNNRSLAFSQTLNSDSEIQKWILNRNGWKNLNELKKFLSDKKAILDAGCGNGRVTALLRENSPETSLVAGIDLVAAEIAAKNLEGYKNVKIQQGDLLGDNSKVGKFDFVYCQEVLHHTSDPKLGFLNLVKNNLADEGVIAIYVYKKKAPLREHTDDFVRNAISTMSYEEAMKVCDQITELGKALSAVNVKVNIPAVEVLGIEKGEYDIQRFIYHFFVKCFWNNELNFHDNSVINYDWYHPQSCTRHTIEEIREWFDEGGLSITHECVDYYGITVQGKKV